MENRGVGCGGDGGEITFWPFETLFNLAINFWIVNGRALIFIISIPSDKTFPWVQSFWQCDLNLVIWPTFLNLLTLVDSFLNVSARAFYNSHEYFLW